MAKPSEAETDATRWSADKKTGRERLGYPKSLDGLDCSNDPILVEESHAEELDINNLIKRFTPEEIFDIGQSVEQGFGNFTKLDDLHTMMNKVTAAQESFLELPVALRNRFNNDPAQLWDALQRSTKDAALKKELQALKLLKPDMVQPFESGPPPKPAASKAAKQTPEEGSAQ